MSTFSVPVVKIKNIMKHPNADSLSICEFDDLLWACIVKNDEFKVGDTVVYVPVDSVIPQSVIEKYNIVYLKNGERVRAVKLRGVLSYGFVIANDMNAQVGENLAEPLGITHYEQPIAGSSFLHGKVGGRMRKQNGNFDKYTDIENINNYSTVFMPGDMVVVTEKIHGCLQARTRIMLADGSFEEIKSIVDNKLDVTVMSMNPEGKLVPSKILNWWNNGHTREWKKLTFTRNNAGRGNSYGHITCTDNHKFYLPESKEYVECRDLHIGDKVLVTRMDLQIPSFVEQHILGIAEVSAEELEGLNITRYDLETTEHNYIANGVVVHNCNFRAGWVRKDPKSLWDKFRAIFEPYEFIVGSHNCQISASDQNNIFNILAKDMGLKEKLKHMRDYVFYGELYGKGVQKNMEYGIACQKIRFFDIKYKDRYLDYEMATNTLDLLGFESVPLIHRGAFDLDLIRSLATGESLIAGHKKEGVVVKSAVERWDHTCGRAILKVINPDYLLDKHMTDFH